MLPNTYEEANVIYNKKRIRKEQKEQRKFNRNVKKCKNQIACGCYQAMKHGEKWYDFSPKYFWFNYWGDPIKSFDYDVVDKALEELESEYSYLTYGYEIEENYYGIQNRRYLVCGWGNPFLNEIEVE